MCSSFTNSQQADYFLTVLSLLPDPYVEQEKTALENK